MACISLSVDTLTRNDSEKTRIYVMAPVSQIGDGKIGCFPWAVASCWY